MVIVVAVGFKERIVDPNIGARHIAEVHVVAQAITDAVHHFAIQWRVRACFIVFKECDIGTFDGGKEVIVGKGALCGAHFSAEPHHHAIGCV